MVRKHQAPPPWQWIDDTVSLAKQVLTMNGVYADVATDFREARIPCPLCGNVNRLVVKYAGRARRIRMTCDTRNCINFVEEVKK